MDTQSVRSRNSVVSSGFPFDDSVKDLIENADKLEVEAYTASRPYMEELLPKVIEIRDQLDAVITQQSAMISKNSFSSALLKFGRKGNSSSNMDLSNQTSSEPIISTSQQISSKKLLSMTSNRTLNQFSGFAKGNGKLLKFLKDKRNKWEEVVKHVETAAQVSEVRTHFEGSVCGVYNPTTGMVEWKTRDSGGIYGVFNPERGDIEWREKKNWSICGVWNPKEKIVEWREFWGGSVTGVYDRKAEKVRWKEIRGAGLCGVWDEDKEEIVWEKNRKGGIVGWWDDKENKIVWHKADDHSGVCAVVRDRGAFLSDYVTVCCNVAHWRK